eukprot:735847-Amphidinium_carterae.2
MCAQLGFAPRAVHRCRDIILATLQLISVDPTELLLLCSLLHEIEGHLVCWPSCPPKQHPSSTPTNGTSNASLNRTATRLLFAAKPFIWLSLHSCKTNVNCCFIKTSLYRYAAKLRVKEPSLSSEHWSADT